MFRTPDQTKKLCTCPIGKVAHLIGDSVSLLIVRDLFNGPKRFNDLATSLSGVSTRTITNKLKNLECEGILTRTVSGDKSQRIEYALTKKGAGLKKVEKAMREYGEQYLH